MKLRFKLVNKARFLEFYLLGFKLVDGDENKQFLQFTTAGFFSIDMVLEDTADKFDVGKEYYMELSEAKEITQS
jgi:hypothetical protein